MSSKKIWWWITFDNANDPLRRSAGCLVESGPSYQEALKEGEELGVRAFGGAMHARKVDPQFLPEIAPHFRGRVLSCEENQELQKLKADWDLRSVPDAR